MKPVVGSIINYVSYSTPDGEEVAAPRASIVTKVYADAESPLMLGHVDLCVFHATELHFVQDVLLTKNKGDSGYWQWPESEGVL